MHGAGQQSCCSLQLTPRASHERQTFSHWEMPASTSQTHETRAADPRQMA